MLDWRGDTVEDEVWARVNDLREQAKRDRFDAASLEAQAQEKRRNGELRERRADELEALIRKPATVG